MASAAPLRRYSFQSPWAQIPASPTARVDVYRQGATVTTSATISNGSTVAVAVADVGAIASGDSVQVGVLGPILSVTAVTPPLSVTLHNATGSTVTVPVGARLIDLTSRPTAYSDATGATALANSLVGDSSGGLTAYLADALYDAILVGNQPLADTSSTDAYTASSGASTSWYHTVSGEDTLLIVAVAWQNSGGGESILGIDYQTTVGGVTTTQAMTSLLSTGLLNVYVLTAPAPGTGTITVTWDASSAKGAVCGATCYSYVNQVSPVGSTALSTGTTAHPDISFANKLPYSAIFSALALDDASSSTVTIWNLGGALAWNLSAGSSGAFTHTQGAASRLAGAPAPVDVGWALSASKSTALAAVELYPSQILLYTDVGSSTACCPTFGLNAQDFGSLAEAIDALGPNGGTVYLPNGAYTLSSGIVIDREQITLIGESQNAIIQPIAPDLFDLITVNAAHFAIQNVALDGLATSPDTSSTGKSCLVLNGLGTVGRLVLGCLVDRVVCRNAPKYGLHLLDTIDTTIRDSAFEFNQGDGARLETSTTGVVAIRILGCVFSQNQGRGLSISNANTLLIEGGGAEGNSRDGSTGIGKNHGSAIEFETLGVNVTIRGMDFEGPGPSAASIVENLVYFGNSYACTVEGCNFSGTGYPGQTANRGLRTDTGSTQIEARACSWSDFQALADSTTVPVDAVAALMGTDCSASLNNVANPDPIHHDYFIYVPNGSVGNGVVLIVPNDGARPSSAAVVPGTPVWVVSPTTPNLHLQMANGLSGWISIA